jgi:holin-like protein
MAWLLFFWLAGEFFSRVLLVPLPGNVIGLILLLVCLHLRWVRLRWMEETAQFLLSHMMLFFAPFIIGTMAFYPILVENWLPAGLAVTVGTLAVLASGITAMWLTVKQRKEERQHADL